MGPEGEGGGIKIAYCRAHSVRKHTQSPCNLSCLRTETTGDSPGSWSCCPPREGPVQTRQSVLPAAKAAQARCPKEGREMGHRGDLVGLCVGEGMFLQEDHSCSCGEEDLKGKKLEEGPQRQLREVNARKVLERPWPGLCDQVHGGMGRERSGS